MRIGRHAFQLFFSPEPASGAAVVDDKKGGDAATAEAAAAATAAAEAAAAAQTPEAKAAAAAAEAAKNETPEAKKTREAAEAAAAEAAKPKVPEKYELKIGKDAAAFFDPEDLKLVEKLAHDKGLSNEQAQALIDDRTVALAAQSEAFRAVTEADETYGGDKLPETQRLAKVALDKIRPAGTPRGDAFRKILSKTGFGNNLEVVSLLADLGKQFDEDNPAGDAAGADGKTKKTAAQTLYDKTPA